MATCDVSGTWNMPASTTPSPPSRGVHCLQTESDDIIGHTKRKPSTT